MSKIVVLKPGKEASVLRRHPWIFSGAIDQAPSFSDGDILPIYSAEKTFLAQGYFHSKNSIAGRILSFDQKPILDVLEEKIAKAIARREKLFDPSLTTAYRLINAEGDGLPGLIVDLYKNVLSIQINTCGMEKLKNPIVDFLKKRLCPQGICEKSASFARRQEGLADRVEVLWGDVPSEVVILENGISYAVSIFEGQKTGFFLDQREMRTYIGRLAKGKRVLNCFSYSGGFSLAALKGGALHADSVDSCNKAVRLADKNTLLNGFKKEQHKVFQEDAFTFLKFSPFAYDLIILDPPAFAKKKQDVNDACAAYKELNRVVLAKMAKGSMLLSSSCSYHIDEDLFRMLLFQAASAAKREVSIIGSHIQALDHPVSIYHPEGDYLKSFLLYIQ